MVGFVNYSGVAEYVSMFSQYYRLYQTQPLCWDTVQTQLCYVGTDTSGNK